MHHRNEAQRLRPADPDEQVDEEIGQEEVLAALDESLSDLDDTSRSVLLSYYWEDQPMSAIAEMSGVSKPAIQKRLHKAREKLRELLGRRVGPVSAALMLAILQSDLRGSEAAFDLPGLADAVQARLALEGAAPSAAAAAPPSASATSLSGAGIPTAVWGGFAALAAVIVVTTLALTSVMGPAVSADDDTAIAHGPQPTPVAAAGADHREPTTSSDEAGAIPDSGVVRENGIRAPDDDVQVSLHLTSGGGQMSPPLPTDAQANVRELWRMAHDGPFWRPGSWNYWGMDPDLMNQHGNAMEPPPDWAVRVSYDKDLQRFLSPWRMLQVQGSYMFFNADIGTMLFSINVLPETERFVWQYRMIAHSEDADALIPACLPRLTGFSADADPNDIAEEMFSVSRFRDSVLQPGQWISVDARFSVRRNERSDQVDGRTVVDVEILFDGQLVERSTTTARRLLSYFTYRGQSLQLADLRLMEVPDGADWPAPLAEPGQRQP
jgi:hypothetical protein